MSATMNAAWVYPGHFTAWSRRRLPPHGLKALMHVSSSEYCERTVDVMLSEGHYQRHLTRLRSRLGEATDKARALFESVGVNIFAKNVHSLYLWASLPGVDDSMALATALLPQNIRLAPGRIVSVDTSAISPWSRYNVGAVNDPRFGKALQSALKQLASSRSPGADSARTS